MDNLPHRKVNLINACPLYVSAEETVGNLLLDCKMVQYLWISTLHSFDCIWVHPQSILELFEAWNFGFGTRGEDFFGILPLSRTFGLFGRKEIGGASMVAPSHFSVVATNFGFHLASWVSVLPEFWGVPIEDILFKKREVVSL